MTAPFHTLPHGEAVPRDQPFFAIDAYGEVQHVEWIGYDGGPFGPYVGVLETDGECFPVSDVLDWSLDRAELEARIDAAVS